MRAVDGELVASRCGWLAMWYRLKVQLFIAPPKQAKRRAAPLFQKKKSCKKTHTHTKGPRSIYVCMYVRTTPQTKPVITLVQTHTQCNYMQ